MAHTSIIHDRTFRTMHANNCNAIAHWRYYWLKSNMINWFVRSTNSQSACYINNKSTEQIQMELSVFRIWISICHHLPNYGKNLSVGACVSYTWDIRRRRSRFGWWNGCLTIHIQLPLVLMILKASTVAASFYFLYFGSTHKRRQRKCFVNGIAAVWLVVILG